MNAVGINFDINYGGNFSNHWDLKGFMYIYKA